MNDDEFVIRLIAGLLSSGHYTQICQVQDSDAPYSDSWSDEPALRTWDAGQDYQHQGFDRRFQFHVLDDAFSLYDSFVARSQARNAPQKF
jgi:hypothetical protein